MLSGSETAITTLPREKIHQLDDSKKNKRIKNAKDDIEQTIGGILVANNFVNILMASLATIIFVRQFGERTGGIIATLFITFLVLIFGEVTPKTIVESIEKELNWGAEKLRDDITCMAINIENTELIKKKK